MARWLPGLWAAVAAGLDRDLARLLPGVLVAVVVDSLGRGRVRVGVADVDQRLRVEVNGGIAHRLLQHQVFVRPFVHGPTLLDHLVK